MPDSNQLFIAYCEENKNVAKEIQQLLSKANFEFQLISNRDFHETDNMSDQLSRQKGKGILLISDNFLKSESCMKDMLHFIENNSQFDKVQIVITDGRYPAEDGSGYETVETLYERVSNVIQYMNFWQEKYLEMRKIKRTLPENEEESFNKKLKLVKAISSQIGDFLRILRTKECWAYESMAANDFELFFKEFGNPGLHKKFKAQINKENVVKEAPEDSFELEHDLSQLPGIDLLTKAENKGIPPIIDEKPDLVQPDPEPVLSTEISTDQTQNTSLNANSQKTVNLSHDDLPDEPEEEEAKLKPEMEDSYQELQALYEDDDDEEIIEDVTADFESQFEHPQKEKTSPSEPEDGAVLPPDNFSDEDDQNDEDPEQRLYEVSNLIEAGEIEQATQKLQNIINDHPENSQARFLLAGLKMAFRKDTEEARKQLLKVIELDAKNHEAYRYLAEIAESNHDFILAKKYYEKVVKLAPKTKGIYYKLALITSGFFKEKNKLSAKYFKLAIKENKKNADAWYRLGVLYNEDFDKPKKALKHFKRVLKLQPDHPFANFDMAMLYHTIGDPRNAASYYHKACLVNPEVQTADNDQIFMLEKFSKPGGSISQEKDSKGKKEKGIKVPKFVKKLSKSATSDRISELSEEPQKTQSGKIVFITGATSGIGKATAQKFVENGYRLILNGRRVDRLAEMQSAFEDQYGANLKVLPFDVRDIESVKKAINELDEEWRQVDILINNAGLAKGYAPIHEGEIDHWETMIDTNLKGLLYLTRAITPHMVNRRSGHIINVCSSAGHEVYPNGNVYCATKFAVDALTKSMRLDLHKYNIRVGQVSPGHVEETEFAYVRFEDKKRAKIYEDFQPLKSSDVAEAIYFMATAPPHVNIQDIQLMGTQQASNNFIDRSGR